MALDLNRPNRVRVNRRHSRMKTSLAGPNAMSRIRVFLIATCIIAVTPRLSADIILLSRLSDAEAGAYGHPYHYPPPQSQTGFLPANLRNSASGCYFGWTGIAVLRRLRRAIPRSSINNPTEGLRVVGDGTASASGCAAFASAKLIVLSFTLTEVAYPYSISGQLNGAMPRPH